MAIEQFEVPIDARLNEVKDLRFLRDKAFPIEQIDNPIDRIQEPKPEPKPRRRVIRNMKPLLYVSGILVGGLIIYKLLKNKQ